MKFINNIENSPYAKIIISIIWGLGLAAIFRKVCKGRSCIIIKSPNVKEFEKGVYDFDNKCYTFKSKVTNCETELDT
jgi:hypothetical protein|tara:strand:- start:1 stop:231 length:231 start_codon:yes stop_codon:yes gene_type:complete